MVTLPAKNECHTEETDGWGLCGIQIPCTFCVKHIICNVGLHLCEHICVNVPVYLEIHNIIGCRATSCRRWLKSKASDHQTWKGTSLLAAKTNPILSPCSLLFFQPWFCFWDIWPSPAPVHKNKSIWNANIFGYDVPLCADDCISTTPKG